MGPPLEGSPKVAEALLRAPILASPPLELVRAANVHRGAAAIVQSAGRGAERLCARVIGVEREAAQCLVTKGPHLAVRPEEEGGKLPVVPRLRMHRSQAGEASEALARQLKAPEQRHRLQVTVIKTALSRRCRDGPSEAAAVGRRLKVAVKGLSGAANRVHIVGGREVVHTPTQQRMNEVELERRHLTAEPEPVEVVAWPVLLPRPGLSLHASARQLTISGGTVSRELVSAYEPLESDGVEGLDVGN
eukprot:scaffold38195_cov64-Phaeocystis_antarctica.AAC.5